MTLTKRDIQMWGFRVNSKKEISWNSGDLYRHLKRKYVYFVEI